MTVNWIRRQSRTIGSRPLFLPLLLLLTLLWISGCQQPFVSGNTIPAAEATATESAVAAVATEGAIDDDDAAPPVSLAVPAIDMQVAVSPLTWRVAEFDGRRTTIWVLPQEGVGWHPDSAGAGTAGNVVISGHQLLGDAPFAPIALGDVAVGQQILLTDAEGRTFVYEVIDITEPLPITDDFQNERVRAAQFAGSSEEPLLTLISGWPDYSSTHRVVIKAALLGLAE